MDVDMMDFSYVAEDPSGAMCNRLYYSWNKQRLVILCVMAMSTGIPVFLFTLYSFEDDIYLWITCRFLEDQYGFDD